MAIVNHLQCTHTIFTSIDGNRMHRPVCPIAAPFTCIYCLMLSLARYWQLIACLHDPVANYTNRSQNLLPNFRLQFTKVIGIAIHSCASSCCLHWNWQKWWHTKVIACVCVFMCVSRALKTTTAAKISDFVSFGRQMNYKINVCDAMRYAT